MFLKKLILDSPIEPLARKLYYTYKARYGSPTEKKNLAYDKQTSAVIRRLLQASSNCVDVGCHRGTLLREMIHYAPAGTHYAFEPIPELYSRLVAAYPGVSIHNLALSDTVGEATFHHVKSNPGRSGLKNLEFNRDESVEEIRVRTDRLDNIIPPRVQVALIKIDVEGAELRVLKGAVETLKRCRPTVVFECGLGGSDAYGATPEEINDLFGDCGLRVSIMEDWLRGLPALSREDFSRQFYQGLDFYYMAHPG